MTEQTRAAAPSVDWSTVGVKESDPPPPRPAENLLMSVLFGLVLLSAGGAVFSVILLLFAGAAGAFAALTGADTRVLGDHADALWALAGATTAMVLLCGTAVGGLSAIGAARNKRRPRESPAPNWRQLRTRCAS
ncbi:hypothetical protein [Rhodococcus koreensis]